MDGFSHRKRRRSSSDDGSYEEAVEPSSQEDSTEFKLALLSSLHPYVPQDTLLDILISSDGSVKAALKKLTPDRDEPSPRKKAATASPAFQSSLSSYVKPGNGNSFPLNRVSSPLTRKGRTLHLYDPQDVAQHTPCSIIHNFLPPETAESLLKELLQEATTFGNLQFKIFDRVVQSPHSSCFYVHSMDEQKMQKTEFLYNGSRLTDVRRSTPRMRHVSDLVQDAVNKEIAKRIKTHYPSGKKLKHQSPHEWVPNAAFVNCYEGGGESVGYHSDQLTYLGPRAVIGSLSLGVAREFRVRKIVPRDDPDESKDGSSLSRADAEGQIAIHLPHNSLLVMHAEMQEEWKHSLVPAQAIDPHPISGNRRINVTYRYYRDSFHPRYTPRCNCNVPTVLRVVQRKKENYGKYMWMCHGGMEPGKEGCSFFQWAEFDEDGEPPWVTNRSRSQSETRVLQSAT
ncbi:hypothetical protein L228DRAFT_265565 [Xylona heveae TC161]|uniref:Uncharacterized protein n=1 Tax=Xylona heveae (strain CBS 132557 / TC161) TaxID=1328760 RepID=A0A165ILT5_XYLHT|nr:hypothetical protein L228DRAFT_265565 [Xylona heveae TC161]KZF25081.1 hypothetical protein L228DRAFT_265565 [Xylona heveae TC161]